MGKDKTDTIVLDNIPKKNEKKKFIENKENSIKSSSSSSSLSASSKSSKGPPKFTLKVRSDLTAEVLEDENSNESISSTNSNKANKAELASTAVPISSSSSSSTSSSSPSELTELTENSSSTSNRKQNNKSRKNIKSTKISDKADTDNNKSEDSEKAKEKEKEKEEENSTQFQIASKNPTGFKLRIVPLEKLLEKPPPPPKAVTPPPPQPPQEKSRTLLRRKTKPVSFIELSDSEDEAIVKESSKEENGHNSKSNKSNNLSSKGKKDTENNSESEDGSKKSLTVRKSEKTIISSDTEDEDNSKKVSTKNKISKKASESSSDSEDFEPKKSAEKKGKSETNKSKNGKKSWNKSSDSEQDASVKSVTKKTSKISEDKNKKEIVEKTKKKTLDSDDSEEKTVSDKSKKSEKETAESANDSLGNKSDSEKNSVSSKSSKKSEFKKNNFEKSSAKRKHISNSSSEESEKEKEKVQSKSKRRNSIRKSLRARNISKDSRQSDAADASESIKSKSSNKAKSNQGPPPSPSTVRRVVVRVKRSKLSDFKDLCKNQAKSKMNGRGKSERPSTSRRKRDSSDEDSDYDFRRAAIAEHDYSGRDIDEDDDDDEEDKLSHKSSDSEVIPTRKRRVFRKDKKDSDNSDSDFEPKPKEKKKNKRRVQHNSSDDSDDDKKKSNRKDIRKIIKNDDLNLSTKEAAKQEQDRRKRIEERQKLYNQIYEKPESIEVTELVLDFDTEDGSTLLEVDKGLMKKLKPHQVTGVKFMWDACFETIKYAQEKSGSGCILAHCMGLGKTMQIVTLSHTLLSNSRKTNVERVLIISPLSTLNNWAREFKHWISFTKKRNIEIFDMSKYKDKATRIFKLNEWFEEGGVCILGYDMYRILANEKAKGLRKKQREQLQKSLVDPGPDLVVCDEGHLLKNEKTSISKAVTRMRTQRRIVLTGTPLQNNLKEYYCMIQFIKPNLLGTYKEYLNRFVNPINNGQYTDSTDRDIRLMKHRSHILHKLLEGCIQRRDYSVLAPYLPPKHEYVVYTTLSILQQLLYEHYMVHQRDLSVNSSEGKGAKLFKDFQELRRIWTHPMNMRINSDSLIRKRILANESDSMEDFIDDDKDEEEAADSSSDSSEVSSKSFASGNGGGSGGGGAAASGKMRKTRNYRAKAGEENSDPESDIEEVTPVQQDDPSEWWKRFVADKELNNINHSPKLVILLQLLEQCEAIGDKLLVFSQSLQSLDTIEHFLSLVDSKSRGYEYEGDVGDLKGFWKPGTDYFRLDGSCSVEQRESMCKKFNDSSNLRARLFLISTRAGGLGINLVSANRVVIFDVSWNPSHDTQSIFRVYRFGQVKPCYIYRLIAMGTMEQKLYERQVAKQATAKRVIDEQQISRHYNQSDLQELYTYELKPSVTREIPILPKDRLFAELLSEHESLLFKYHEHDSLLENEESENLSAEERKAAWSEYEAEKTKAVQTAQYVAYDRSAYGGQFGNSSGSVTSNKIFGFRSDVLLQLLNMKIAKDHPEMSQNQVIQVVPTYLNELYSQMNSGDPTMYKDLLNLHGTLTHPSGMYMNPLLYVNQNPQAAGYFQSGAGPPTANGVGGAPVVGAGPVMVPAGGVPIMGAVPMANPQPAPVAAAPGFDPNEVYEID